MDLNSHWRFWAGAPHHSLYLSNAEPISSWFWEADASLESVVIAISVCLLVNPEKSTCRSSPTGLAPPKSVGQKTLRWCFSHHERHLVKHTHTMFRRLWMMRWCALMTYIVRCECWWCLSHRVWSGQRQDPSRIARQTNELCTVCSMQPGSDYGSRGVFQVIGPRCSYVQEIEQDKAYAYQSCDKHLREGRELQWS